MMSSRADVLRGLTTGLVLLLAATVSAQENPSGHVSLESKSIAAGVGVSWGDGKLLYQGKEYPFSISGLSVVDVGISKVTATGDVYNLKKVSDFSGNYVAAQGGAAVGGGGGGVSMRNQHGVVMNITGTGTGVKLALGAKGVDVKLKK
jgi:hypothetical protein